MNKEIFDKDYFIIIFSIILGFGLSVIFKIACNDRDCIILRAPNKNLIVGKTFKHNSKCYQYLPYNTVCNNNSIKSN